MAAVTMQMSVQRVGSVRANAVRSVRAAAPVSARRSVVVSASAEDSRRAVLSGMIAGVAALSVGSAQAVTPVDLIDDRAAVEKGFDLIYEARDLDLTQAQRDGFTQARGSLEATKARIAEASTRIKTTVATDIQKAYWTEAKEELRRQVGTLRFDLNTVASTAGDKAAKKMAIAGNRELIRKIEDLDYSVRSKDKDAALQKLGVVVSALDALA
mmetsp:Transcript_5905/g.10070  ORF Transcript_5905/g.10070 Transcript_5905/m.10070 type:complete len:213 (-) Transcript_5905:146-784(-)